MRDSVFVIPEVRQLIYRNMQTAKLSPSKAIDPSFSGAGAATEEGQDTGLTDVGIGRPGGTC